MTAHVPTLLAVLGTVLMAIVIFAPVTPAAARPAAVVQARSEVYSPLPFEAVAPEPRVIEPAPALLLTAWPAEVDASAATCDAAARLALVDALAAIRSPWADAILRRAHGEEPDPRVRAAIAAARAV